MNCFSDYLVENGLPNVENISNEQLAGILENFYCELSKKKVNPNDPNDDCKCKTSLRCMRAALARYFKATRCIHIIKNELFITANGIFVGMTKINKEEGLGEIISYPPIEDADMKTLNEYFIFNMRGSPNPRAF